MAEGVAARSPRLIPPPQPQAGICTGSAVRPFDRAAGPCSSSCARTGPTRACGESNEIYTAPSRWSVRLWRACRAVRGKPRPASTVAAFGVKSLEIIEAEPDRMREVSGIGEFRAERLSGWAEEKAMRDIMIFVHSHGGGTSRAVRILNQETSIIGLYLLLPPVWPIDAPFLLGLIDYFRCRRTSAGCDADKDASAPLSHRIWHLTRTYSSSFGPVSPVSKVVYWLGTPHITLSTCWRITARAVLSLQASRTTALEQI